MLVVSGGYAFLALLGFIVYRVLDARDDPLRYPFAALAALSVVMAAALLVQTRNINNVVAFNHGLLIPYHASHPVPAFTRFNRVVPWSQIIGVERSHGLRVILADGRDFLLLFHHDQIDELEQLIRRKLAGK